MYILIIYKVICRLLLINAPDNVVKPAAVYILGVYMYIIIIMYLYGNSREGIFFFVFVMNRISFNLYGHNIVINITPVGQSQTLISNGSYYIEA